MAKIIWSPEGLADMQDIFDYISNDSVRYAERMIEGIMNKVELLTEHPSLGRQVPEIENEFHREVFFFNYRIMYYTGRHPDIYITRVLHSSRNFKM